MPAKVREPRAPILGRKVALPQSPNAAVIDLVPAPDKHSNILIRFSCPEFTSLCPVTGQPDFAHIVIDYVPRDLLIESKSLKLFLGSFRNHGDYHEACTTMIGKRLVKESLCAWMRVSAFWYPRGGIPIDVFWEVGVLGSEVRLPPIDIPTYRAR